MSNGKPLGTCILAAGKGTRMKSSLAKVLQPLAGAPMIEYVLDSVAMLAPRPDPVVVVTGHQADRVEAAVAAAAAAWPDGTKPVCVRQEPQLGTGHAVQVASSKFAQLAADGGDLLVLLGDVPLITPYTLQRLVAWHRDQFAAATMLTMQVADPTGYGRVLRNAQGMVEGVVEHRDATDAQRAIREVNTGIFVFNARALIEVLPSLSDANASREYYLPDVIPALLGAGRRCAAQIAEYTDEVMGVNTFAQLAGADRVVRERILAQLMDGGVHVVDPSNTYIDKGVAIGADTTILPYTVIRRGVTVGSGCEVGPFAHLRAGTVLHDRAEIGNFVECKKAVIGSHTKAKHLSYLGDVTIGEESNIGAGTIVCNYDGKAKHATTIGDRAFIGSDSLLVAPRTIGNDARTGAGAVVTKDVADGVTVVGIPARPVRRFGKGDAKTGG